MLTDTSISIIVVNSILAPLCAILVALRLVAGIRKRHRLEIDDYLIVAALVTVVGGAGGYIAAAASGGIGHHERDLKLDDIVIFLQYTFALQFPYIFATTFVKLSVLSFYKRIFTVAMFERATMFTAVLITAWCITFFFATLLQTIPISNNWMPDGSSHGPGRTINVYAMYIAASVSEIALDITTLILPLSVIWRLQMQPTRKLLVSGIFVTGAFVCIASIIRLNYLIRHLDPSAESEEDLTYSLGDIVLWSSIEPLAAVTRACLPTLGPIVNKQSLQSIVISLRSLFSLHSGHSGGKPTENSIITVVRRERDQKELAAKKFIPLTDQSAMVTEVEVLDHANQTLTDNQISVRHSLRWQTKQKV